MTRISIASSWLCATGVVVLASYCILTHFKNTPSDQKKAAALAERISKRGTIAEYKNRVKYSSAIKKTTVAKVTDPDVKCPKLVPNPIYPPFTNALAELTRAFADLAKDGDVVLTNANGFVLSMKDGKPFLKFPEAYGKVDIGGVAMGSELKGGEFAVSRRKIPNTEEWEMDGIGMYKHRHLDEPQFYCAEVTYHALPATKQVDSIQMHGDLIVGNSSRAQDMIDEIATWMKEDLGAVDQKVSTPAGTLALKKFKIGNGMDVEVKAKWNTCRMDGKGDAEIDVTFTTTELEAENKYQRETLGKATDTARASEYSGRESIISPSIRTSTRKSGRTGRCFTEIAGHDGD